MTHKQITYTDTTTHIHLPLSSPRSASCPAWRRWWWVWACGPQTPWCRPWGAGWPPDTSCLHSPAPRPPHQSASPWSWSRLHGTSVGLPSPLQVHASQCHTQCRVQWKYRFKCSVITHVCMSLHNAWQSWQCMAVLGTHDKLTILTWYDSLLVTLHQRTVQWPVKLMVVFVTDLQARDGVIILCNRTHSNRTCTFWVIVLVADYIDSISQVIVLVLDYQNNPET